MADDQNDTDEKPDNIVPMRLLSKSPEELLEHPNLSLANVKGLSRSKDILKSVIQDAASNNREPPLPGILMYGPPNCGKRYLTRVLAGELRAAYLPIDVREIIHAKSSGARIVRDVKRIVQRNLPCVLLLEDIDTLHLEESKLTEEQRLSSVYAIAEILDDAAESTDDLFLVVATATDPWLVPSELVSQERLGQILLVLPPDKPARLAMLTTFLRDLTLEDDVDLDWLAQHTDGYSGTDLRQLCANAYEIAHQDGHNSPHMSDLKSAFNHIRPNAAAWLDRAAHQAMLSGTSGLYDDLLDYLNARRR